MKSFFVFIFKIMIPSPLSFLSVFSKSFVILCGVFSPLSSFAVFGRTLITVNENNSFELLFGVKCFHEFARFNFLTSDSISQILQLVQTLP